MPIVDPLPQTRIETEITRLSGVLDEVTHDIAQRATDAARADAAYDAAYYSAFVMAEGPMDLRKAEAKNATAREYARKVAAEAVYESLREKGRNVRAQLEALRSINANHRSLVS